MRTAVRVLAVLAVAALLIGVGWAFVSRNTSDTTTPALLLVVGVIAAVDATALFVLTERRPDGLRVGSQSLPAPRWWPPILAAGVVAAVGGAWVSLPVAVLGVVVVAVGAWERLLQLRDDDGEPGASDRRTVRTARQVVDFGRRHGGAGASTVSAVVEPLGHNRIRLVLVAPDGTFGDLVVSGRERRRSPPPTLRVQS